MLGILRVKISNRSSDRFLSPNGPTNPNFCRRLLTRLIRTTSKQLEYQGDGSNLCRLKTGPSLERTLVKLCRPRTANLLSAHLDTRMLVESAMFEVSFKIQHDCPYTRFSMKNPDVRLVEWCNNRIHVMEVDCPDIETFTRVEKDLNELLMWKIPKKMTAEEIAQKHHVPRTTFEEHLRKAESKILRAIAPYVRMYSSRSEDSLERPPQIPAK
jgi:predicted DNA-binding protein (UPF0251 family)